MKYLWQVKFKFEIIKYVHGGKAQKIFRSESVYPLLSLKCYKSLLYVVLAHLTLSKKSQLNINEYIPY